VLFFLDGFSRQSDKYRVSGRCSLRPDGDVATTDRRMAMEKLTFELLGAEGIVFDIGEYVLLHLDSKIAVLGVRS